MTADLADLARRWSDELPAPFVRRLAGALRDGPDAVRSLSDEPFLPASADAARRAAEVCEHGQGPYLAGLLTGRLDVLRSQPTITAVWTGPESAAGSNRLTLGALSELIGRARHEIVLVSYATLPGRPIRQALGDAARRGVEVVLLLERPEDNPHFTGLRDPFPGLEVRQLYWPAAERPNGASMHAKLLVVDRAVALVGSANLTDFGVERNLECGLLIEGGPVPGQLVDHLLRAEGIVPLS